MNFDQSSYASLPEGSAIELGLTPVLGKAHHSRLRKLWSYGRPVNVQPLSGIELDLIVHGLVESQAQLLSPTAILAVTRKGLQFLNDARQSLISSQAAHHCLAARLAKHLQTQGFHTWENIEFSNPIYSPSLAQEWSVVRPDVFACLPTLKAETCAPTIYEVKVSRADFLADLAKPEKRGAYADLAEAVYYCCADGLIAKDEVPDGCGLLVETSAGLFRSVKRPQKNKLFRLHVNTAMNLMVKRQVALSELDD
ncbi:hypothetical protein [Comamonas testosteroni]|jgi:hypothetical protein|uniref:hypothetical protein n=1 Tax=Comamonas testosteroni TaxID=285 RepID=UPI0026ED9C44|nr:hypothetical protein [Comamonas testosteroni]